MTHPLETYLEGRHSPNYPCCECAEAVPFLIATLEEIADRASSWSSGPTAPRIARDTLNMLPPAIERWRKVRDDRDRRWRLDQ